MTKLLKVITGIRFQRIAAISVFLCLNLSVLAKEVLFIGNSYTGQSRQTIQEMLDAENCEWNMTFMKRGSFTLARHLQNPQNIELMKSKRWDAVILQEQGQTPAYPNLREGYFSSLKKIQEIFKENKTPIYLFTSWGKRDGDKVNIRHAPTYEKMQSMLDEGFAAGAKRHKMIALPLNKLWRAVMASNKELGQELYKRDGSHPSAKGAYLVALSTFCILENEKPADIEFRGQLTEEEFTLIKKLAEKVF